MQSLNVLVWNCRGIVNRETQHALVDLVRAKRPSLIFLAETLAQPSIIDSLTGRLGFAGNICFSSDQEAPFQGVALLWNSDMHASLRSSSPNHIDADISMEVGGPVVWRFTGIYGVASRTERRRTWDMIESLAAEPCSLPWIMAGDFNEIMSNLDKSGGPPRAVAPMLRFRQTMTNSGLYDMGFVGSRFTWSNRYTKERLDRSFQNMLWRTCFPFSRVITLNPLESDHVPLLVEIRRDNTRQTRPPQRFRFEEMWHGNEMCHNIIQQNWSKPLTGNVLQQLSTKIHATGVELLQWHRVEFAKQKVEMRVVQEKLNDLMKAPYSPEQYEEQRRLHVMYSQMLAQQEKYWRQRSRSLWLQEGDRNSAFFHRRASNRRSRNFIKGLNDAQGVWRAEPERIHDLLMEYYNHVFATEGTVSEAVQVIMEATAPKVTDEMNLALLRPYTDEEIKKALFQMHPSKSPGPDGMSPFFFQKYWHIVGMDVCMAIRNFLEKGEAWEESNFTHLCLIPKVPEPTDATHFRPIALCNVIYRICSKVVANRLKVWLPSIISPLQSAYVPGRLISDNSLVANEVAHFMHKLRHQEEGFFSLKLDISKAYDRLEWTFLRAMLLKLGFAIEWVEMIMSCVMSVRYAILINGKVSSDIIPTRDDSLFFGSATERECTNVRRILDIYARASGQQINFEKSSVVFSRNVSCDIQTKLSVILEVQCRDEHDKYLGLPLHVGKSKTAKFLYIKEKITKKLVGWKSKILSCAGKEVMIKAVAQSMPLYAMNCYLLPKSLCDDIHQLCASFFWGDTNYKKKIHWRSWERLCVTKQEGGMGFKNIYAYNLAMLAKQGWRLVTQPDSLIAQVYKARYFPNGTFWEAELGDSPSFSWRSILNGRPTLQAGTRWRVGDGSQINIWQHQWIPHCPTYLIHRPSNTDLELVSSLMQSDRRSWNVEVVQSLFLPDISNKILAIPLSRQHAADKLIWSPERRGRFSVKSAYWIARQSVLGNTLASSSNGNPFQPLWKQIWNARVPGKVQICVWRAANDLLPTRDRLCTKGYMGDTNCLLCRHRREDTLHLFCKCPVAVELLSDPSLQVQHTLLSFASFKEWLLECALRLGRETFDKIMMMVWALWQNRNTMLWDNSSQTVQSMRLHALAWLADFQKARANPQDSLKQQNPHWQPEVRNRPKLNVDGAFVPQLTRSGTGGVLRNSQGQFMAAFAHTEQHTSSARQAELLAIRRGLDFVKELDLQHVTIESDCLDAVQLILNKDHELDELGALVEDCLVIMASMPEVRIQHAVRTRNNVAHRLAAFAFESDGCNEVWHQRPPSLIINVLQYDFTHIA
ncbi:uncharacterized protein LOC133711764 [Rosa rugosa]|uniref:uncharacterized protein LOC133711764 n=1 Tax=Rosa rugosa TaxID=74645 RepID=UPI002B41483C|nr:uncharacterized protein LOC133711764 [Rosa rugosa]